MLTAPPRPTVDGPPASASRPASSGPAVQGPRSAPSRLGATAALAGLTAVSAGGLYRVFSTHSWVGPVAATIVVVHVWCWAMRRAGLGQIVAAPLAAAAVVLMAVWTVLGYSTHYGLPTGRTWHQATTALGDLSSEIASLVAPVVPTGAFELVAVAGAGVAASLGDWAAFRWKTPLVALIPGLATFIFCCTSGQGRGRGTAIGLEVAAVCLFLLTERATDDAGKVWFAGTREGVASYYMVAGGMLSVLAIVIAIALSPALAPRDGSGTFGWRNGLGANGGERIVPNPLVNLQTHLTRYQNTPAFRVTSSIPSYWRLTSLNAFDGSQWTSTGSYRSIGERLPGAPPANTQVQTAVATFTIQQLDSVWLPAQFDPYALRGARRVTYDPASDSLLAAGSTADGLVYTVSSFQRVASLSAAALGAAPPVHDAVAEENLRLPESTTSAISGLAQAITEGAGSEYAKATDIQNYLRSPPFRYSLSPATDGSGDQALEQFLFVTRTGYCQQFAGSFAVLARAAGLPTRLAVGFDTGTSLRSGGYQVFDRDLHTWPEVWFGPAFGWVPFEPTPRFEIPQTGNYLTTPNSTAVGPGVTVPTTTPTTVASSSSSVGSNPRQAHNTSTTAPAAASTRGSGAGWAWWLIVPGLAVAWLLINGAGPIVARNRRRREAARRGPAAVVLRAWAELATELIWFGVTRRPDETHDEFARRASGVLRRSGLDGGWTYGGLEAMAAMARRAAYAPGVPEGMGEQATVTAGEILARVSSATTRRQRASRLWRLPPGTGRRLRQSLRGREPAATAPIAPASGRTTA